MLNNVTFLKKNHVLKYHPFKLFSIALALVNFDYLNALYYKVFQFRLKPNSYRLTTGFHGTGPVPRSEPLTTKLRVNYSTKRFQERKSFHQIKNCLRMLLCFPD